ncbi:MAG: sirohydrochlorin chelatase [Aphanizomenon gracile PMC649.10]|nr:sirohydrochlorin chelatase [Aphanizomenon gracile PMC638.10]MDM3849036.1 sirohydrochlorin chelatase [Aphanizomenon gracile PMC627.10]MDM3856494.1 sirohydrochlorin chelatase [Aphanizomenon gracile PMC649.10]MDM3862222.1 sirohydrochlorin chelatase [Aphanizomenon gracile PMC644.10]
MQLTNSTAYLLVSHGSRDPRPDLAMQQLAGLLREILPPGENFIEVATLEANIQPLHLQIQDFANRVQAFGCKKLQIIPLFLLPGFHVMTDIPAEIALVEQVINKGMIIELRPYIGSYPGLEKFFAKMMMTVKADIVIILAHGSRRAGSHTSVESLAASVGAVPAYWSVPPSLDTRVQESITAGYRQIAIFPYFLFTGGITDAIAQAVETLKLQFPSVSFQLAPPLGTSREFADLIENFITEEEKVVG